MRYARPTTLDETIRVLSADDWAMIAGGTDYFPGLGDKSPTKPLLDLSLVHELRGIWDKGDHWKIGGLTTWTDIVHADYLPPAFDALKLAARELGSVQIQNAGTIAGNLCNASPAADGVPALQILDAKVELQNITGARYLPLEQFIIGNRRTLLKSNELLTSVIIPKTSSLGSSHFIKHGARKYLVISIAMVAVRIVRSVNDRVESAAVSVGSCSPVAVRLEKLEAELAGQSWTGEICDLVEARHLNRLTPIDDVRGTGTYRLEVAEELIRRALVNCIGDGNQPRRRINDR